MGFVFVEYGCSGYGGEYEYFVVIVKFGVWFIDWNRENFFCRFCLCCVWELNNFVVFCVINWLYCVC